MSKKTTRRAMLSSIIALTLCFAMLIGTTYAWFTDSVTSANNIIKSGTLNIDLGIKTAGDADYVSVKNNPTKKAFDYELWEPGYTEWVNAKVSTTGNLALKYTMKIVANGDVSELAEVIDVYYANTQIGKPDQRPADLTTVGLTRLGTLAQVLTGPITINDTLIPAENNTEDFATLVLHMQESAGNEYQDKEIGTDFAIQILATQYTYEVDSFDKNYDENAQYPDPVIPTMATAVVTAGSATFTAPEAPVDNKTTTVAITGIDANDNDEVVLSVNTEGLTANDKFEVADDHTAVAGIDLSLVKADGGTAVTFDGGEATVTTYITPGFDPSKITVKYNGIGDQPTDVSYEAATGKLTFKTTHFSEYFVDYEGIWYYIEDEGLAFADDDALFDYICGLAEDAVTDLDKLNVNEIIAGYEYITKSTYSSHLAIYNYLISGEYGFGDEWLCYDAGSVVFNYTKDGTTKQDLKTMLTEYEAVYNYYMDNPIQYKIYPTLKNGFYATGARMTVDPYECDF